VKPIIFGNEIAQVSTFNSISVMPYSLLPRQSSYTQPPENTTVITIEYRAVVSQKVRGILALLLYSKNQISMLMLLYLAACCCSLVFGKLAVASTVRKKASSVSGLCVKPWNPADICNVEQMPASERWSISQRCQ
jgi:hypothetical protein